jgi:hypothetical protein
MNRDMSKLSLLLLNKCILLLCTFISCSLIEHYDQNNIGDWKNELDPWKFGSTSINNFHGNLPQAWSRNILTCISDTQGFLSPPAVARCLASTTTAMFDAVAPYTIDLTITTNATEYGIPILSRRPVSEHIAVNRQIALSYAIFRVFQHIFATQTKPMTDITNFFTNNLGLDPTDNSKDQTSPIGIGKKNINIDK